MIDLQRLKELEAKATPGPWKQGGWTCGASQYSMMSMKDSNLELGRFHSGFMGDIRNSELTIFLRNNAPQIIRELGAARALISAVRIRQLCSYEIDGEILRTLKRYDEAINGQS